MKIRKVLEGKRNHRSVIRTRKKTKKKKKPCFLCIYEFSRVESKEREKRKIERKKEKKGK